MGGSPVQDEYSSVNISCYGRNAGGNEMETGYIHEDVTYIDILTTRNGETEPKTVRCGRKNREAE